MTDSRDSSFSTADESRISMTWEANGFGSKTPSRPQSIYRYNVHTKTYTRLKVCLWHLSNKVLYQVKRLSVASVKSNTFYPGIGLYWKDATDNLLTWYRTLLDRCYRQPFNLA
jgi:hypothetical protein